MEITYGAFTFPANTSTQNYEKLPKVDAYGNVWGYDIQIIISGDLIGSTAELASSSAMMLSVAATVQNYYFSNSGTVLEKLLSADCSTGPACGVKFAGDSECDYVTHRKYSFTIQGTVGKDTQSGGGAGGGSTLYKSIYEDSYDYDAVGNIVWKRTHDLEIQGGDASAYFTSLEPSHTGYNKISANKTGSGSKAKFEWTYKQLYLVTLGTNISDGGYKTSEWDDLEGQHFVSLTGTARTTGKAYGDDWLNQIVASLNIGDSTCIEWRPDFDYSTGEYTFSCVWIRSSGGDDILKETQTVSYSKQLDEFAIHNLDDGALYKEVTGRVIPAKITQSGSSLGRTSYPGAPQPLFPENVKRYEVTKKSPRYVADGSLLRTEYEVSWNYEMELESDPGEPATGAPV